MRGSLPRPHPPLTHSTKHPHNALLPPPTVFDFHEDAMAITASVFVHLIHAKLGAGAAP